MRVTVVVSVAPYITSDAAVVVISSPSRVTPVITSSPVVAVARVTSVTYVVISSDQLDTCVDHSYADVAMDVALSSMRWADCVATVGKSEDACVL